MKKKCKKCKHHRPNSGLIGKCAMQSITNVNSEECEDFKK